MSDESNKDSPGRRSISRGGGGGGGVPPYPFVIVPVVLVYLYDIPVADIAFAVSYSMYILVANAIRFDNDNDENDDTDGAGRLQFAREYEAASRSWFQKYISTFAVVGVALPTLLLIVIAGYSAESGEVAQAAAPHLFLLLSQIYMEHLSRHLRLHGYVMCLVPIGFSVYRQAALCKWLGTAYDGMMHASYSKSYPEMKSSLLISLEVSSLVLAAANTVMWTYNTFIFLLLRMMPTYIDNNRFPIADVAWRCGGLVPVVQRQSKNKNS